MFNYLNINIYKYNLVIIGVCHINQNFCNVYVQLPLHTTNTYTDTNDTVFIGNKTNKLSVNYQ